MHLILHIERDVSMHDYDTASLQQPLPVVLCAWAIIIARCAIIQLAHTNSPDQSAVRDADLALVINCAPIAVVAIGAKLWDPYTDTNGSKHGAFHCPAEAWALIALIKVVVSLLAAHGAGLAWHGYAPALFAITTAQAP
jgi:hypothetical protein